MHYPVGAGRTKTVSVCKNIFFGAITTDVRITFICRARPVDHRVAIFVHDNVARAKGYPVRYSMTFLEFQPGTRFYQGPPSEDGISVDKELYEIADKRRSLACRTIFKCTEPTSRSSHSTDGLLFSVSRQNVSVDFSTDYRQTPLIDSKISLLSLPLRQFALFFFRCQHLTLKISLRSTKLL